MQLGVEGVRAHGHPPAMQYRCDAGPALGFRIAGLRVHIPAPLQCSGFGIVRFDVAGYVEVVSANAGDHMIFDYERRNGAEIHLVEIADGRVPAFLAVFHVERHEIAVGRLEVEPIAIRRGPTPSNVNAALRLPREAPYLTARCRVDGPGVVRKSEVQNTVYE